MSVWISVYSKFENLGLGKFGVVIKLCRLLPEIFISEFLDSSIGGIRKLGVGKIRKKYHSHFSEIFQNSKLLKFLTYQG